MTDFTEGLVMGGLVVFMLSILGLTAETSPYTLNNNKLVQCELKLTLRADRCVLIAVKED